LKVSIEHRGLALELDDGILERYERELELLGDTPRVRAVYAAAHVVMHKSYKDVEHSLQAPAPGGEIAPHINWKATAKLRSRLDSLGFGIAEAMDTAQRFHIGWDNALRLIEDTGRAQLTNGFVAGAGVDHLAEVEHEDQLVAGVVFQVKAIQSAGGIAILLPLVWLCANHYDEQGYVRVYERIIDACDGPLLVHWLGEMFLPALAGYFPGASFSRIMALDPGKVRGAKLSLLDADIERRLRKELLERDQIMLTGDDFNFGTLMAGHEVLRTTELAGESLPLGDFSHGLLGIFDGVARPASLALKFLAHDKHDRYLELMAPCERLGRHLFQAPTQHYKAGLAFLSWLNGHQDNPMLALHEQRARDLAHYCEAARLASLAGAIEHAGEAGKRLERLLGQS
jgi:hypothetical protein